MTSIRFLTVIPLYASPCVRAACPQIASIVRLSNPASWAWVLKVYRHA
jgi:hypothetical protein